MTYEEKLKLYNEQEKKISELRKQVMAIYSEYGICPKLRNLQKQIDRLKEYQENNLKILINERNY